MIALLLDQGLPLRAAADLREERLDVVHANERGLQRASDAELLELARDEDRTIVTLDSDISMLLATTGATRPSVVHIRLARVTRSLTVKLVTRLVTALEDRLRAGCIAAVTSAGVRV